ncbi:MAG TPA: hypothetical protein DCP63_11775, partial [Bacteroidetes bacterium]|nr:hypothetical protein [Bacteroidota bacterium]
KFLKFSGSRRLLAGGEYYRRPPATRKSMGSRANVKKRVRLRSPHRCQLTKDLNENQHLFLRGG